MPKIREQANKWVGRIILGGAIASGVIGGGIKLAELDLSGAPTTTTYVAQDFITAKITASGGLAKYDGLLLSNPLVNLSGAILGHNAGSGLIIRLSYQNIYNPGAVSHDICYVTAALTNTGSANGCILQNTCTSTGCLNVVTLTGSMAGVFGQWAKWAGDQKIKVVTTGTTNSAFDARLRISYEDIAGE